MYIRAILDKELIDRFAVGRDDARGNFRMRRLEFLRARQTTRNIPPKKGEQCDECRKGDVEITTTFGHHTGDESLSWIYAFTPLIATRTCCIESRSRMVTVWSVSVSESIVTQNGVPISSMRR